VTRLLAPNGHLFTLGLASCTALALIDPAAGVVSLAHFDGSQTSRDVATMIQEMVAQGAQNDRIVAFLCGGLTNMTVAGVYNDLDGQNYTGTCTLLEVASEGADCCAFGDGFVGSLDPNPAPAPAPRGGRSRFGKLKGFFKKIF
jgi:Protein N-terminal asparagine amidohydrolase